MAIIVKDNDLEKALNKWKRFNQHSGLNKEVRKQAYYIPKTQKKKDKKKEGMRRWKRELRRRMLKEGY
ncbi:MAG: 30S ribosomal protein S21 [Alphaproteobacteria bacterium 40-19]|nr:MAG: 30S ribosomal protein S21 [Alphaproteobacteria bacterium 40-19]